MGRNGVKDRMLMLGSNKVVNQLSKANSVGRLCIKEGRCLCLENSFGH